jgi:hypothetical protein
VDIRFVISITTSNTVGEFQQWLFRSVFIGPLLDLFRPENISWLCDVTYITKRNEKYFYK